jgi:hypothetical protein
MEQNGHIEGFGDCNKAPSLPARGKRALDEAIYLALSEMIGDGEFNLVMELYSTFVGTKQGSFPFSRQRTGKLRKSQYSK